MDTSGFYKYDSGELLHAPNYVLHASFELHRENLSDREQIIEGWQWFDTREEAAQHHGLTVSYE